MKNSNGLVLIIYDFSEVPKLGSLKINFVKYLREKKKDQFRMSYSINIALPLGFNENCIL